MKNFNPIRGTNDFMPRDALLRDKVKRLILDCYIKNGFNLISTPILEHLELLNSSDGGDNLRLIFKTVKRGETLNLAKPNLCEADIVEEGLRYDLTVPLARFYANNKEKLPTPFKSIQVDYSFRAERPQRGRDRQFTQCDIDIFADPSINAELELLSTVLEAYSAVGLTDLTLKINHRQILNAIVLNAGFSENEIYSVCVTLDKIDKISTAGVLAELTEKGFNAAKIASLVHTIEDIKQNGLNATKKYGVSDAVFNDVKFLIDSLKKITLNKFNIVFDISIVRGQGYYTGAVFEVYTSGFAGAIGGGGRYDKMLGKFSGCDCPAVGFGLGFEPVCMLVKENNLQPLTIKQLALIYEKDDNIVEVYKLKNKLKKEYNVSLFLKPKNMKSFYDKIVSVADFALVFKDYAQTKQIKKLS